MDQVKSHMAQSIKTHNYLIKLTPLLVSVTVFPFLFSPSSIMAFLHQFSFYFSTFPLQLFTHNIDKNCMFLLCNGLLMFVGITRSLSGSSGGADESYKYFEGGSQPPIYSDAIEANQPMMVEETRCSGEEVEENIEDMILEEGKGSEQYSALEEEESYEETEMLGAGDEGEEKESEIDEFLIGESVEEEEDVEETNWVMSTEELNKKFDDFIRRMKEDLRIEAQRQLVMV